MATLVLLWSRARVWSLALVLVTLFLGTGCASIRPAVVVTRFGESDPAAEQELADQVGEMDVEAPVPDVELIAGSLPEGLALEEQSSKLVVKEGYEDRYDVIGAVEADYERGASGGLWKNLFWTWDYSEKWRNGYCAWQVPFKILTLGVWSYVIPAHYPCVATIPGEEQARAIGLQADMKRAADLMGGNLVILTNSADLFWVKGDRNGVRSGTIKKVALRGFVVRVNDTVKPHEAVERAAPSGEPTDREGAPVSATDAPGRPAQGDAEEPTKPDVDS